MQNSNKAFRGLLAKVVTVKLVHIRVGEFADTNVLDRFVETSRIAEKISETVQAIRQQYPDAKFWKDGSWQ